MSNAAVIDRPRTTPSLPSAEANHLGLGRATALLTVRAHAHLRQSTEVSLWALSEAAAEAAEAIRAHRRACEAQNGLLASAARDQREFTPAVGRVWADHLLLEEQAAGLVRLASGVHPVGLHVAYQKALLIERLVRAHTRRVDEVTFEVTLRDFGGQG
jgi:hypothetical protein